MSQFYLVFPATAHHQVHMMDEVADGQFNEIEAMVRGGEALTTAYTLPNGDRIVSALGSMAASVLDLPIDVLLSAMSIGAFDILGQDGKTARIAVGPVVFCGPDKGDRRITAAQTTEAELAGLFRYSEGALELRARMEAEAEAANASVDRSEITDAELAMCGCPHCQGELDSRQLDKGATVKVERGQYMN